MLKRNRWLNPLFLAITGLLAKFGISANAQEVSEQQTHYPASAQQSFTGPEENFTGEVNVVFLFPANDTAKYSGALVTFQPGARTAWHSHPAGQHMVVTEGVGVTGTRDGEVLEFQVGDAIWCPPDIDHWHGATRESAMTHLVLTGTKDGENVVWKEKVSDTDYDS